MKKALWAASAAVGLGWLLWGSYQASVQVRAEATAQREHEQRLAQATASRRASCESRVAEMHDAYAKAVRARDWSAARNALAQCAGLLQDTTMQARLQAVDVLDFTEAVNNRKLSPGNRLVALDRLHEVNPDAAIALAPVRQRLTAQIKSQEAAERRSRGVEVGMSADDVLASSWGRPERVNRTITASGSREQWVYPGGNYLYLQNGVLTSIQVRDSR